MVSKVPDQVPDFDISKYQETGELGKYLDKSLLSGTSPSTTIREDVSTIIDNLVHNLMAICFQVETCVKSLSEGKFKWVNKEDVVQDLHNEISGIFTSIANPDQDRNLDNFAAVKYLAAIRRNINKFEEVYKILQKAGVDSQTIQDIRNLLDNAKRLFVDNFIIGKKEVKPNVKGAQDDTALQSKKRGVDNKRSKTYEDRSSVESSTIEKDYARVKGFKNKEKELRKAREESAPSKFNRKDAESLFSQKKSDVQKNEYESDEVIMKGHPKRVGGLKQEKSEIKAQIRTLEKELISLQRDKPKLKQRDENGKLVNKPVTPAEARLEKARVKEQKAKIPDVTKQLEDAKALLESKRADLRKQDNPTKIEKRKLKEEIKQAKGKERELKQLYNDAITENKTPAERKLIREDRFKASEELIRKKAAYEEFKKKHI